MSETSKTADRVLAILIELAAAGPSTPQQLALRMGANRTVTQRLLTTLLTRGFVRRAGGEYSLDERVRTLAAAVQPELRLAAVRPVDALSRKLGETAVLQIADGDGVVVLHEAIQVRSVSLQVRHDIGSRSPLVQSASGLAILASCDEDRQRKVAAKLEDSQLLLRLAEIRQEGFAVTSDELQIGVSGLARVVMRNQTPIASVAILVPTTRKDAFAEYREDLSRCVSRIERSFT